MTRPTRVVVTGIGLETCAGRDVDSFWDAISNGKSGIRRISRFETDDFPCSVAGEVDLDPSETMSRSEARRSSRFQRLHHSAVVRAVEHAGGLASPESTGLFTGTSLGGFAEIEDYWAYRDGGFVLMDRLGPVKFLPHAASSWSAELLGIQGPCLTVGNACAASTDAIRLAADAVRSGSVRAAIAAGSESWITPPGLAGFAKMGALTTRHHEDPTEACRPFDADRSGVVPSEGAAALVLEEAGSAEARGATIWAEVLGAASTCDAFHPVAPREDASRAAAAIDLALQNATLAPDAIDHINAHGTSTPRNDVAETAAIRLALGDVASSVSVTGPKSLVGHALGAAGVIETAICVLSIAHQFSPPTINLETPDPMCDLDYTPQVGHDQRIDAALKLSFGFGGYNTALVLGPYR